MRVAVPLRPTTRAAVGPYASGFIALIAVSLMTGCSDPAASLPAPTVVVATGTTAPTPRGAGALSITSSQRDLTLTHWTAGALPVTFTGGQGSVTLRMERMDGQEGDVIEVTPSTLTPGSEPGVLKLRPTRVAFPAPEGAAPWKLVASQAGKDIASLDLNVTLNTVNLRFTLQPVTAAEGQTVDAVLSVDADSHDLPSFTFSLDPYIPEETESYELVSPTTYTVTSLPATFRVPITFKAFHGDSTTNTTGFQLSVDGLADALGSNRYLGKYVRANLTWNLAR